MEQPFTNGELAALGKARVTVMGADTDPVRFDSIRAGGLFLLHPATHPKWYSALYYAGPPGKVWRSDGKTHRMFDLRPDQPVYPMLSWGAFWCDPDAMLIPMPPLVSGDVLPTFKAKLALLVEGLNKC